MCGISYGPYTAAEYAEARSRLAAGKSLSPTQRFMLRKTGVAFKNGRAVASKNGQYLTKAERAAYENHGPGATRTKTRDALGRKTSSSGTKSSRSSTTTKAVQRQQNKTRTYYSGRKSYKRSSGYKSKNWGTSYRRKK